MKHLSSILLPVLLLPSVVLGTSGCRVLDQGTKNVLRIHVREAANDMDRGLPDRAVVLLRGIMELQPKSVAGMEVMARCVLETSYENPVPLKLAAEWCGLALSSREVARGDCGDEDSEQSGDAVASACGYLAQNVSTSDGFLSLPYGHHAASSLADLVGSIASDSRSTWPAKVLRAKLLHDAGRHSEGSEAWRSLVPRPYLTAVDTAARALEQDVLATWSKSGTSGSNNAHFGAVYDGYLSALRAARAAYEDDRAPFFGSNARAHGDTVSRAKLLRDAGHIRTLVAEGKLPEIGDGGAWIAHAEAFEAVADTLGQDPVPLDTLDPDTQLKPIEDVYNRAVYAPQGGDGDGGEGVSPLRGRGGTERDAMQLLGGYAAANIRSAAAGTRVLAGSGPITVLSDGKAPAFSPAVRESIETFLREATVWNSIDHAAGPGSPQVFRAVLSDGFHPDVLAGIAAAASVFMGPPGGAVSSHGMTRPVWTDAWATRTDNGSGGEGDRAPSSIVVRGCSGNTTCAGTRTTFVIVAPVAAGARVETEGGKNAVEVPAWGAALIRGGETARVTVKGQADVLCLSFGHPVRMGEIFADDDDQDGVRDEDDQNGPVIEPKSEL